MSENETPDAPTDDSAQQVPMPPASFEYLVATFRFQTEMQLGLLHFGEEKDRPKPDLQLARHSIDLLAVLLEKTKGNLTFEEHRLLENSLTELRFRYIHAVSESQKT